MEWKKLILLFIGIVTSISGFIGLIVYLNPIFLYIITIGVMAFVVRHYHDGRRVNVTMKYVKIIGLLLLLQLIIIFSFGFIVNPVDSAIALVISLNILIDFTYQVHYSDLSPFTIFGRTYTTFELVLTGSLIIFFLLILYIAIAA